MTYKTIVLELLQQRPRLHGQLRQQRRLRSAMEAYASAFKRKHEAWMEALRPARPGSDPSQIASEALELALEDLLVCLACEFPPDDSEALSLDQAMAFLRRHTPPA